MSQDPHANILTDDEEISAVLRDARRIAVLGIKPETRRGQPAHYVPAYLQEAGYQIVPVPVYYPDVTEILGEPVYRTVSSIPEPVDLVVVFRRSEHLHDHLEDLLAAWPRAVWLQSGIEDDDFARRLAEAGVKVVQDRCSMIYHRLMR